MSHVNGIARRYPEDAPAESIQRHLPFVSVGIDAQPGAEWRGVPPTELDQVAGNQPEVGGHGGRHAQDAVPAEPALVRVTLVGDEREAPTRRRQSTSPFDVRSTP
jgi:hypothetical protein